MIKKAYLPMAGVKSSAQPSSCDLNRENEII